MHADRTNRTVLVVLALVLLAAGGLGAAASFGLFGSGIQRRSLTDHVVADYAGRNGTWFWPVVAVAALLLVLLCLRWLLVILFSTDRAGDLEVQAEGAGHTRLSTAAVTRAVTDEIESYRGVSSADARMIGHADDLTLVVTATVEDTADLPALRERIESEALAHARAALDDPDLPIQLDLTVATGQSARVQ